AIRLADDSVGVDLRLALVDGDVPDEREDFDLLFDGNLSILLRFDVEEAKRRSAEGADRGEIAAVQAVLEGKALDPGHELLAGIENDNVGLESVSGELLRFHPDAFLTRGVSTSAPLALRCGDSEEKGRGRARSR